MPDVNVKFNDSEILWVQPEATGQRVPTAQELAASSHLHLRNLRQAQEVERPAGLRNRPSFNSAANRGVVIPAGTYPYAPGHPGIGPIASPITVNLPALADNTSTISRYDYLYLCCAQVVVNSSHDSDVNLTFEWKNQAGIIQTLNKENTQRLRSVWWVVHSIGTTTAAAVATAIPTVSSIPTIAVTKASTGLAAGSFRFFPLDPALIDAKAYEVRTDTIVLIDLLRVWRAQRHNQSGYVWGVSGEPTAFEAEFHLQPTYRYVGEGWDDWGYRAQATLRRIMLGRSISNSPTLDRAVCNLINGQVGTNAQSPGLATASPNGSTALANGQRVSFTNQAIVQKSFCQIIATANVSGVAQATVPFQVNSPIGSRFSEKPTDHRVYRSDGRDITRDGTLTGLGGTGALVWTARDTSLIVPGDTVYVQPGIYYPPGSGFPVTGSLEKVFLDNVQITPANVLEASINDLGAYAAPSNSENYWIVAGKERAALHYILRRYTVTADAAGIVRIPANTSGTIVFISGPSAPPMRQDKPIVTGLTANATYSLLCYYPPKATEQWQFQIKCARYAGSGEKALLNGAIATRPLAIAHSHGGANTVFQADGDVQYEPIAFRLPYNTLPSAPKPFLHNYKIQFGWEAGIDTVSYRENVALSAARGLAMPRLGQEIVCEDASQAQSKGLPVRLKTLNGQVLGVQKPPIACDQPYQLVISFIVLSGNERRLVVITLNGGDPTKADPVAIDTDLFAAIDTFNLY